MSQPKHDIALEMKQAMSAGQFQRAARIGARLVRLHSKRTDIQVMTAVSELQGGLIDDASRRLRQLFDALDLNDRHFPAVTNNFFQYAQAFNDYASLEAAVRKRLSAAPQSDMLLAMLADVIFRREIVSSPGLCHAPRLEEAIEMLRDIPLSSAKYADSQKLLARIYLHQEQYELASSALEDLFSRSPNDLSVRMLLASSYAIAGKDTEAVKHSLGIIKSKPDYCAQPYLIISFMRPLSMPEGAKEVLAGILDNTGAGKGERYKAAFALAKIEEAKGNMEEAFGYYQKGHSADRAERPFDITRELEELQKLCDAASASRKDGPLLSVASDPVGPKPIFIVGMPRSGTTLSERILGAHPDVHAAGEIGDLAKAIMDVVGPGAISEQAGRIDAKAAAKIRKQYLDALAAYAPEKKFVTNKTPANYLRVAIIRKVFPDAPIVHTHRHPLATCLSIYTTPFSIPMRFANDLGEFADFYRGYVELMNACLASDDEGRIYDLSYEDLVSEPEAVARDYLAHCGLEWHPECLEFYRSDKAAATASMLQVRRPINQDSVEKWQRFEPFIGPLASLADDPEILQWRAAVKSSRRAVAA
ncbi:hypothetical protein HED22_15660 [Thalassospira sp. HF15]|uniref:tetratricopeptide repeat-containing sulfotransferase family protein n=1 Tax=Thalassospira sp. HF15 TaxID=2722755 RepID=UPI0014313422|nr:sulfotransferase [Thalassospira sp. HF15]NIY77089.1 hypothetical protein [Thalassospira sp. HF15]